MQSGERNKNYRLNLPRRSHRCKKIADAARAPSSHSPSILAWKSWPASWPWARGRERVAQWPS